jgi:hypothetical protein
LIRRESSFRINSSKVSMRCSAFSAQCSAAKRADSTRVRRTLTCVYWSVTTVRRRGLRRVGALRTGCWLGGLRALQKPPRVLMVWTVIESLLSDSSSNSNELPFWLFTLFLLVFGILCRPRRHWCVSRRSWTAQSTKVLLATFDDKHVGAGAKSGYCGLCSESF